MHKDNLFELKKLIDQGEVLLNSGYEISAGPSSPLVQPVFDWLLKCNSYLAAQYGKNSEVFEDFTRAYTLQMSVNVLVSLASSETRKNNSLSLLENMESTAENSSKDLATLNYALEQILLPSQKTEASALAAHLRQELTLSPTDWEKVRLLLKSAFDFGITFGCSLAELVYEKYKGSSENL